MMKNLFLSTFVLGALVLAAFTLPSAQPDLSIGDTAPMTTVEMLGVSGDSFTLDGVKGENGLLVLFSCNTCPWVAAWENRYPEIAALAEEQGIGMIVLNSNAAARNRGDGYADMQKRAEARSYDFPYVVDEGAELAAAFGATKTPEAFLFNSDMSLVYHGAIDDNAKNIDQVEQTFLKDAMVNMVAGQEIEQTVTKSVGCTIKFP